VTIIDEVDALAKVIQTYPRNSAHPRNASLKVSAHLPAGNKGPGVWQYRVLYTIPPSGAHAPESPENLLDMTPVVNWGVREKEIPMEFDGDTRFVCNSAGFPPDSPPTRTIDVDVLQIKRYEPLYNLALLKTLRRRVNASAINLGGNSFDIGQIYLRTACPAAEFPAGATPILMLYEFEFDDHATQPFQTYFADRGSYGWATDPETEETICGPFGVQTSASGEFQQITAPVILDGTGAPMDSRIMVGQYKSGMWVARTPIAFPNYNAAPFDQASTEEIPSVAAWVRRYRKALPAEFSVLGLL
jgi:hypothetical protein